MAGVELLQDVLAAMQAPGRAQGRAALSDPTRRAGGLRPRPGRPLAPSEQPQLVEIDQRSEGRVEVTLLWSPSSGQLAVLAIDEAAEEALALEVAASEALDVFRRPFAYLRRRPPIYRRALAGVAEAA